MEYLLNFLSKIRPVSEENLVNLLKRCIAALAHRGVTIGDRTIYAGKYLGRAHQNSSTYSKFYMYVYYDIFTRQKLETASGWYTPLHNYVLSKPAGYGLSTSQSGCCNVRK